MISPNTQGNISEFEKKRGSERFENQSSQKLQVWRWNLKQAFFTS